MSIPATLSERVVSLRGERMPAHEAAEGDASAACHLRSGASMGAPQRDTQRLRGARCCKHAFHTDYRTQALAAGRRARNTHCSEWMGSLPESASIARPISRQESAKRASDGQLALQAVLGY